MPSLLTSPLVMCSFPCSWTHSNWYIPFTVKELTYWIKWDCVWESVLYALVILNSLKAPYCLAFEQLFFVLILFFLSILCDVLHHPIHLANSSLWSLLKSSLPGSLPPTYLYSLKFWLGILPWCFHGNLTLSNHTVFSYYRLLKDRDLWLSYFWLDLDVEEYH